MAHLVERAAAGDGDGELGGSYEGDVLPSGRDGDGAGRAVVPAGESVRQHAQHLRSGQR